MTSWGTATALQRLRRENKRLRTELAEFHKGISRDPYLGRVQSENTRLRLVAEAAENVFIQREAGICIDARQVGWEALADALKRWKKYAI
jgi:hypothetical protein